MPTHSSAISAELTDLSQTKLTLKSTPSRGLLSPPGIGKPSSSKNISLYINIPMPTRSSAISAELPDLSQTKLTLKSTPSRGLLSPPGIGKPSSSKTYP